MVPVIILMGIGPLVRWKDAKISDIIKRTAWCFIAAVILGAATPLIKGWSTWLFVGLTMSWWVLFTFIESLRENTVISRAASSAKSSSFPALGGA